MIPASRLLLHQARCLASLAVAAAGSVEERLSAAYASRVAKGQLEDDEVQKKVVQFLAGALQHASAACAGEGRPTAWAWPTQVLGVGTAAAEEDRRRVAEYTARMAAENARRARGQAPATGRGPAPRPGAAPSGAGAAAAAAAPAGASPSAAALAATGEAQARQRPVRRSVYMHGPVGTGKTMLLDLFHSHTREAGLRVQRKHFYEFMLGLHQQIHEIQEERPVEVAANRLADSVDVICFDEFQITDIQDAVILPRLFEVLFLRGVVVVMTSNTAPQLLYSGGLNRHVHLPAFVALLADHCTVLGLGGPGGRRAVDYRRRAEVAEAAASAGGREAADSAAAAAYLCGPAAQQRLRERWAQMLGDGSAVARELDLPMGRRIALPEAAGDACLVGFRELCGTDRGEADFLALAEAFRTVLVSDVPKFDSLEATDEVRRFVKLLDVLYDRRVRLVLAAAAPVDELFVGVRAEVGRGDAQDLAWRTALYSADGKAGMAPSAVGTLCEAVRATERAESRLREMGTRRYWQSCEEARGSAAGDE